MTDVASVTAQACMTVFGEPITYNGAEHRAIPATEMVELAGYDQALDRRMTISVLVSEFPPIEPGAVVVVRGKTYRVDQQMDGREDPDVMVKLVLR